MKAKNKDWTGNKKTTFVTLGSSSHSKGTRQKHDYYATDPIAVDHLLAVEPLSETIWECSCGEGHLSRRLETHGFKVISTDLVNRGYGQGGIDFLKATELLGDTILTNPPYKYAQQFVEKGLDLGAKKVIMFLKLTFLESQSRKELFLTRPPARIWVFSSRIKCAKNGKFESTGSSAAAYAWFVWEQSYKGRPEIGWIA